MKKLLAVDGNSIINRAFYGIRPLSTRDGRATNAIYGTVNIINRQLTALSPDYVAVCFDVHAPTFRHKLFAEYKAGRRPTPPELLSQFDACKAVLTAMGLNVLELPGYEADDIQGTLARMAEAEGIDAYILSGDRDLLQLIDGRTTVLLAGNSDTTPYDDPVYDDLSAAISAYRRVYFALSDFSQEEINALTERQRAILQYYQGFSPYADPTTGFELSYERKFGVKPTFEECKFYDGLLLAGLACHKQAVENKDKSEPEENVERNIAFNQAIYKLTFPNTDASLSASIWDANAMQLYLRSLDNGQVPKFRGASGNIAFDAETCAAAAGTTYVHWRIMDGKINFLRYFSSNGNHRAGEATVAWKYYYDENAAQKRFAEQAQDKDAGIDYAPLTDKYALLVHASTGFSNYRHLSDVLSVYQQLKRNGFDDEHIILIADRSVADDPKNPEPGIVRTTIDGPDLMAGVQIDYDATTLTAANIMRILMGQRSDQLPVVIPPDAGNNVFLYWSGHGRSLNHGGANEFQWRDKAHHQGVTAQLLHETVTMMQRDKSFRKLLIVAEPCYGECVVSELDGIPGVLAMTGANAQEQSWADNWNPSGAFWMSDRFTQNFVTAITEDPTITYRDLYLYCVQHTLGSHARVVNAAHFGNLYHSGPEEFVKK